MDIRTIVVFGKARPVDTPLDRMIAEDRGEVDTLSTIAVDERLLSSRRRPHGQG